MWHRKPEREQKEETKQSRWGFRGMTVRNWLELLIVPLVLVGIGLLFENQQASRQLATEKQQQALEERRAEAERKLAEQRAQEEALQAYLDQMSQLMLERNLLEAEPGDPVHTLAQARTSTVILRLDAAHNESVTRFLINSGLAVRSDPSALAARTIPAVRSEASARLLSGIALSHATLSDAQLLYADVSHADLSKADLRGADLSGADLSGAFLNGADLLGAILQDADLSGAVLRNADLSGAFLNFADLSDADLLGADLSRASLLGADLSDASLAAADLSDASLDAAEGITNERLELQAVSLEGATMPNGQKYEDWLKDRE